MNQRIEMFHLRFAHQPPVVHKSPDSVRRSSTAPTARTKSGPRGPVPKGTELAHLVITPRTISTRSNSYEAVLVFSPTVRIST